MGSATSVQHGEPHPYVCHTCCIRFMCQTHEESYLRGLLPHCPCCDSDEFIEDLHQPSVSQNDPLSGLTSRLERHGDRLSSTAVILSMLEQQLRDELSEANDIALAQRQSAAIAATARDPVPLCIIETFPKVDRKCITEPCCICSEDYTPSQNEEKKILDNDQEVENQQEEGKQEEGKEEEGKQEEGKEEEGKEGDDGVKSKIRISIDDTNPCKLPGCGHIFHRNCIGKWLRRSNTCPMCRSELETIPTLKSLQDKPIEYLRKHMSRWGLNEKNNYLSTQPIVDVVNNKDSSNRSGSNRSSDVENGAERVVDGTNVNMSTVNSYDNSLNNSRGNGSSNVKCGEMEQLNKANVEEELVRLRLASELHAYLSMKPKGEEEEVEKERNELVQETSRNRRPQTDLFSNNGGGSMMGAFSNRNIDGEEDGEEDEDGYGGVVSAMARSMTLSMERAAAARRRDAVLSHRYLASEPSTYAYRNATGLPREETIADYSIPSSVRYEPPTTTTTNNSYDSQMSTNNSYENSQHLNQTRLRPSFIPPSIVEPTSYDQNSSSSSSNHHSNNLRYNMMTTEMRNRNNREDLYALRRNINSMVETSSDGGSQNHGSSSSSFHDIMTSPIEQRRTSNRDRTSSSTASTSTSTNQIESSPILLRTSSSSQQERVMGDMIRQSMESADSLSQLTASTSLDTTTNNTAHTNTVSSVDNVNQVSYTTPSFLLNNSSLRSNSSGYVPSMRMGGVLGSEYSNNSSHSMSNSHPISSSIEYDGSAMESHGAQVLRDMNAGLTMSPIRHLTQSVLHSRETVPLSEPDPEYTVSLNPSGTFTISSQRNLE